MKWIRANIGLGSRLALVALAIQFALAFAHSRDADHHAPGVEIAAADSAADRPGGEPSPASHEANCDICAVMAMAGTALVAPAPALPPPPTGDSSAHAAGPDAPDFASIRGAYQSRAPPVS